MALDLEMRVAQSCIRELNKLPTAPAKQRVFQYVGLRVGEEQQQQAQIATNGTTDTTTATTTVAAANNPAATIAPAS